MAERVSLLTEGDRAIFRATFDAARQTPRPMNADDYGARAAARKQLPSRFDLIRFADFKPLDDENDCVKGLLPRRGLAVFWGPPKCGKSFLVFDLLMHVALGWDYRGLTVKQGPIVYLCLEGGRAFRRRREAFRLSKLKEGDDPPFFFVTNPLSLAADHQGLIGDIRRQMGEDIPAVVCIDTLNRSLAGSESDDRDMSAYIKAADALQNAFGCLVVIVHHCGHDAQRPRGHSSLMGALDVQIAVSRDAEGNVVAELELAKDGEAGVVFVSRLEPVEVGRDAHGAPVVSCVVKEIEDDVAKTAAKKRGRGERGDDVAKVKHALAEAYGRLADAVETSLGFGGESVKKVPVGKLRDEVKSRGFLEADDDGNLTSTARKHFQRAKTGLIASKRFIEADGKFWRLVHD